MSTATTEARGPLDTPIGVWHIDPMHSSIGFTVRHLMSRVRGSFTEVAGQIGVGTTMSDCSVSATVATASIHTGTSMRDDDLRSENFFDADHHPELTFSGRAVDRGDGSRFVVTGDLTIRGTTRQVRLDAEFLGLDEAGLQGEKRIGFAAHTTINRSDFGVGERPAAKSKIVVGDEVTIELDIEAYLDEAAAS